ncbi:hypothetical protein ACLMJK_002589 [Lecanora helva]
MFRPPLQRALLRNSPQFVCTQCRSKLLPHLRATITTSTTTTDPNPPETAFNPFPNKQTPTYSVPSPTKPPTTPRQDRLTRHSPLPPPTNPPNLSLLPLLAAQPPHYITAHLHARPYLLTLGDALRLPFHLPHAPPGTIIRLNRASTIGSRDYTLRGAPWVDEGLFVLRCMVTGLENEPLRVIEKTKRRCRKVRRMKHKMRFTILRVCELRILPDGKEGEGKREEDEGMDGE